MIYLKITDPSGHHRDVAIASVPATFGTDLSIPDQFRDSLLPKDAIVIQKNGSGIFVLKSLLENEPIRLGDLKLGSLEIPMGMALKIGETELCFADYDSYHRPQKEIDHQRQSDTWLTVSESGKLLLKDLKKSSATKLSIYLLGETGTGKEVLAKQIHAWSERANGPFISINCGALSLSLSESELFGHVRGAFTGAIRDRPGALLKAHGGTLFLDEVGDLPLELQVKLLRFLENGEIKPVGSELLRNADVRVICATHKSLVDMIRRKEFRQDLFYRLASIPVDIPPLRERPEDIQLLAKKFTAQFKKRISKEAIHRLNHYSWPGNVRELKHAIERAIGVSDPGSLSLFLKDFEFLSSKTSETIQNNFPLFLTIKEMEKAMILKALQVCHGNRTDAAKSLGVARSTLFDMMNRHKIIGPKRVRLWAKDLG